MKMKKKITGILAVMLALAMVVSAGIYERDSRLKASDENVYEGSSENVTPAVDVQEIFIEAGPAITPEVIETVPVEEPAQELIEESADEPAAEPEEEITEEPAAEPAAELASEEEAEPIAEPVEEPAEELIEETVEETDEIAEEIAKDPAEEAAEQTEEEAEAEEAEADEEVPEAEEERVLRVWVTNSLEGVETVEPGTEIILTAHLEGFEGLSYRLQWQRSLDGIEWEDEPNATEAVFRFILTDENDDYIWRIMVYPA